jgi:hypothetical protein
METLSETTETPIAWPDFPLLPELNRHGASLNSLIIGRTQDGTIIRRSLHELMHTLAVGVTGKGKTTWLLALLAQLAVATEPVEVVAIDTRGAGFNILDGWGKMRYPLARTDREAVILLNEVRKEIHRRMDLYRQYPIVDKLPTYNRVADESLAPWVCVVDEGTQLLGEKDVADPLRECVQCGRQYGVYVVASGQTAKHTTIGTEIRDNFVTRLAFRTSPTSTRVVLGENPPHPIDNEPGLAWAQLDGDNEFVEMRGPVIERGDFLRLLTNGGPRLTMPVRPDPDSGPDVDQADDPTLPDDKRARRLYAAGLSKRQISLRVYGGDGGAAWRKMEDALGSSSSVEPVEEPPTEPENGQSSTTTTPDTPTGTLEGSDQVVVGPDGEEPGWCEFCEGGPGRTFGICAHCGVAVCSQCAPNGLCPDCRAAFAGKTA